MHSLFLKIFLWFWLAMALVGATVVTAVWTTQPRGQAGPWREFAAQSLALYGQGVVEVYEQQGEEELERQLVNLEAQSDVRVALFDEYGREVLGRYLPAPVEALAERTQGTGQVEFLPWDRSLLVARPIVSSSGVGYVVVSQVPRRTLGAGPEPVDLAIRLLAVLAVAGILCYGLSRYLTSPVLKLRDAARRLAGGELTVRVDPTLASRSDEFSDLGQDFDVMAERIESLVRSQRRLLSDISHELRSPLSRLKVAVELARRPTGNEAPGYLDRIEREADRMNHLIGQLLSLARLDDETQVQSDEVVALLSLLREIAADAEFEANSCRCTVQLAEARECSVRGSAEILRSALENVVRNAVHYTASGTAVEVALRLHDRGGSSRAIITVRDHGPGVPPESLPYLFRPFYRVGDARDRQSGGSGLGLAIAERAVRLHGGSIEAANAPDGGLVVTVELPVAPSRLAAASPLSGSASESASGFGNMRNQ